MSEAIKKIAINTGGGDAPGLNAVIHGAVYAARGLGWRSSAFAKATTDCWSRILELRIVAVEFTDALD